MFFSREVFPVGILSCSIMLGGAMGSPTDGSVLDLSGIQFRGTDENDRRSLQDNSLTGSDTIIFKSCHTVAAQSNNNDNGNNNGNNNNGNGNGNNNGNNNNGNGNGNNNGNNNNGNGNGNNNGNNNNGNGNGNNNNGGGGDVYVQEVKSYVEFEVCNTAYCHSNYGNRTTYITSLSDYMNAFASFLPDKKEEYCEACKENEEYCKTAGGSVSSYQSSSGSSSQSSSNKYYNNAANQRNNGWQQNGWHRGLQQGGDSYQTLDCDRCRAYNCFYEGNRYYNQAMQWSQELSMDWIEKTSSCYQDDQDPVFVNGNKASYGFVCRSDGKGVDVGVFADNSCTKYVSQMSFSNVAGDQQRAMSFNSKQNVQYIFNTEFSCYKGHATYGTTSANSNNGYDQQMNNNGYDQQVNNNYNSNYNYNNNNGNGNGQASEYCQNVFAGEMTPISMDNCNQYRKLREERKLQNGNGNYNGNANYNYNYNGNGANYQNQYNGNNGYGNYDAEIMDTICSTFMADTNNNNNGNNGYWDGASSWGGSSSSAGQSSDNWLSSLDTITAANNNNSAWNSSSRRLSSGGVAALVLLAVAAVVGVLVATKKIMIKRLRDNKAEPILDIQGGEESNADYMNASGNDMEAGKEKKTGIIMARLQQRGVFS